MGWWWSVFGRNISPYGRGIRASASAAVIWAAQFFVPEMSVSLIGALIAAFAIGVIDMFVPTALVTSPSRKALFAVKGRFFAYLLVGEMG